MTPPYFHDGSIVGLDQAISVMADVQLGLHLNPAEVKSIRSFLESLTGRIPSNFSHIESFAQKDSLH
jgi:cytochrome c peroxidase